MVEQLVWGKYCETPSGPIVDGAEHSVLGTSRGFPRDLVTMCDPTRLGVARTQHEEAAEQLFGRVRHGTVLRPVAVGDQVYSVLYRVGVRSEGGVDQPGRRPYSLGCYLVDPSGQSGPRAMFCLLEPLQGTTRGAADGLPSLSCPTSAETEAKPVADALLRPALTHLISGVPVHLKLTESDFFAWVDQLWRALPQSLRPWLSAGWNVSSSVADTLALCTCARSSPCRAEYEKGTWRQPTAGVAARLGRPLLVGEWYAAAWFDEGTEALRALFAAAREMPPEPANVVGANAELTTFPAFSSASVVQRFRRAGIDAAADAILDSIRQWLDVGADGVGPALPALLACVDDRPELLTLIRRGLANQALWPRADTLCWLVVSRGRSLDGVVAPVAVGAKRALLFEAAWGGDGHATLAALLDAALADEGRDLPDDARRAIASALGGTVHERELHSALLQHARHVDVYPAWVRDHAFDLALALSSDTAGAASAARIAEILTWGGTPQDGVAAIVTVLSDRPPSPQDLEEVAKLSDDEQRQFASLLERIWKRPGIDLASREKVLEWSRAAFHAPDALPTALRAARGIALDVEELAALVQGGDGVSEIPGGLWASLSESALVHCRRLRPDIAAHLDAWAPLLSLWPGDVRLTLIWPNVGKGADASGTSQGQVGASFVPDPDHLQELIEEWLLASERGRVTSLPRAARVLWQWVAAQADSGLTALRTVDICRCLQAGAFSRETTVIDDGLDHLTLAITLTRLSGEADVMSEHAGRLWASATDGWQMQLLLELFPAHDFRPSVEQLVALLPHARWLDAHLRRRDVAATTRGRFAIARYRFGEIDDRQPGLHPERYQWSKTPLMGAFSPPPIDESLFPAITAYGRTHEDIAMNCVKVLAGYGGHVGVLTALTREFICRWAAEVAVSPEELIRTFRMIIEPTRGQPFGIVDHHDGAPPFRRVAGTVGVGAYMVPLFWQIAAMGVSTDFEKIVRTWLGAASPRRTGRVP